MNSKKIVAAAAALFWASSLVVAPCSARDRGAAAVGFLAAGAGSRASAMGEAYSALPDEASAVYWNPAALATLKGRSVALMRAASVESTAYSFGAYGQKVGSTWGVGLGVQHQSSGSLEGRDTGGFSTAGFTPTDTAFSLAVARQVGSAAVGVTGKWVRSRVVDSANTVTGDVGSLWPGLTGGKFSLALTATNVGGKIKYESVPEDLPTAYRAGLGYRPSNRWVLALDVVAPKNGDPYGAAGAERTLVRNQRFSLDARAGYNTRSSGDAGGLSGAAFGMGFGLTGLAVDYAFLPLGDLGQAHRVSLAYSF